jgi:[protein-PII] uridylyltransferase
MATRVTSLPPVEDEVTIPAPPGPGRGGAKAALSAYATRRTPLEVALDSLSEDLPADKLRSQVIALLRKAMDEGRAEVRARFDASAANGTRTVQANARVMDGIITAMLAFVTRRIYPIANPTVGERLTLVAVGGYGRGELAPFSDIDLLFIVPYKKTPHSEQVIEYVLYLLWDLGLKVGQAIRSVDECIRLAKSDITIRTAVLETRHLWGDTGLYKELRRRFRKEVVSGTEADYVEQKLAERDARHQRMGDSRYVLEPNVKEGKGGLRDLHTLFWITK